MRAAEAHRCRSAVSVVVVVLCVLEWRRGGCHGLMLVASISDTRGVACVPFWGDLFGRKLSLHEQCLALFGKRELQNFPGRFVMPASISDTRGVACFPFWGDLFGRELSLHEQCLALFGKRELQNFPGKFVMPACMSGRELSLCKQNLACEPFLGDLPLGVSCCSVRKLIIRALLGHPLLEGACMPLWGDLFLEDVSCSLLLDARANTLWI